MSFNRIDRNERKRTKYLFCGSNNSQVFDSLPIEHALGSKKVQGMLQLQEKITTFDRSEETLIMVVKSDNREESFDRRKIWAGIDKRLIFG